MKIVFMGTPDFAKESLEAIYNAGHEILAVVTNTDKPKIILKVRTILRP